jgi:hypothetical protein
MQDGPDSYFNRCHGDSNSLRVLCFCSLGDVTLAQIATLSIGEQSLRSQRPIDCEIREQIKEAKNISKQIASPTEKKKFGFVPLVDGIITRS